jgi:hypothetical protein
VFWALPDHLGNLTITTLLNSSERGLVVDVEELDPAENSFAAHQVPRLTSKQLCRATVYNSFAAHQVPRPRRVGQLCRIPSPPTR